MIQKELYEKIGLNIKTRRQELKLKQSDVAEAAGISRPSLANIEGGRQALTMHLFYKLAGVLDLTDGKSLLPSGVLSTKKEAEQTTLEINTNAALNDAQMKLIERTVNNVATRR